VNAPRLPAPEWAVWSLMTALWIADGRPGAAEGALVNLTAAIYAAHVRGLQGQATA
jgi:hypothetical protein